jgi:hypothetical protein
MLIKPQFTRHETTMWPKFVVQIVKNYLNNILTNFLKPTLDIEITWTGKSN